MKTTLIKIARAAVICALVPILLVRVTVRAARRRAWAGKIFLGPGGAS